MKHILYVFLAMLSAPAFGTLYIPFTVLAPDDLADLGLTLNVRDITDFAPFLDAPLNFTLTASDPDHCVVDDVYIFVRNSVGNVIYGSSVARRGGLYSFQLEADYLDFSTISLVCPDENGESKHYSIELGDHVSPSN